MTIVPGYRSAPWYMPGPGFAAGIDGDEYIRAAGSWSCGERSVVNRPGLVARSAAGAHAPGVRADRPDSMFAAQNLRRWIQPGSAESAT